MLHQNGLDGREDLGVRVFIHSRVILGLKIIMTFRRISDITLRMKYNLLHYF